VPNADISPTSTIKENDEKSPSDPDKWYFTYPRED